MKSILWLLATLLAIMTIPVIVLSWLTESSRERARRLRREGYSQRFIAEHLGISTYRVRKLLGA